MNQPRSAQRPRTVPPAATILAMAEAGTFPGYPIRMSPADRAEVALAMEALIRERDLTIPEAARFIGLTTKQLAYRCARDVGLKAPKPAVTDAQIIACRLTGATRREIATTLAVTLNRVDDAFARATPEARAAMATAIAARLRADAASRRRLAEPKAKPLAAEMHRRRTPAPITPPTPPRGLRADEFWRIDPRTERLAAVPLTKAEEDALIAQAIAAGRITKCPPAAAAPINQGRGFIDPDA